MQSEIESINRLKKICLELTDGYEIQLILYILNNDYQRHNIKGYLDGKP